jgi:hypothetical protein
MWWAAIWKPQNRGAEDLTLGAAVNKPDLRELCPTSCPKTIRTTAKNYSG